MYAYKLKTIFKNVITTITHESCINLKIHGSDENFHTAYY